MSGFVLEEQQDMSAEECMARFPKDKRYQCIYADIPWSYSNTKNNGTAAKHYPCMKTSDVEALPVADIADKTSLLFMWATSPLLPDALRVISKWGFCYKTIFICWTKRCKNGQPKFGTGWFSRPSVELLLVATRGSGWTDFKTTNSMRQEYASVPGAHSEKPAEVRLMVRDFLNVPKRIELFARTTCPGFDAWGLDLPGYFIRDSATMQEDRGCEEYKSDNTSEP